ncbi:MAG: hypothetical protein ABJI22_00845 [Maribacter sp.]
MTIEELKLNIEWWESKRWNFNVAVGIFGILALYRGVSESEYYWSTSDTLGVITWVVGVKIFYSLGLLLELFAWYYLNNRIKSKRLRIFFFIGDTLFSSLWTYW